MVKAISQYTITDLNDAIIAGVAPLNPTLEQLWIKDIPNGVDELYKWNGSAWAIQSLSLAGLDPIQNDKLEDTSDTAINLDTVIIPALQGRLTVTEDAIKLKVEKSDYNALEGRFTNQQSTIEQMADSIAQKVTHDEYNELTQQVSTQETQILQTSSSVAILATKSESVDGRLTTAEASIVVQSNSIALKAEKSDVYTKTESDGKVSTAVTIAKADIKITTDSIASNVTSLSSTVTGQGNTITSQGTSITQMNNAIALKAEKAEVYTKTEADGKVSTAITSAKADIKITTDSISSSVTSLSNTVTSQGNTITTQGTSITSLNNSITLKAEKADVYTKVESDGKISTAITTAKSDVKVTTDSIALNVSNLTSTVTSQGTTITSQGTSITSLNNSIALKAEKTDVYTKTEADGKTGTAVATAKADIKITTDGITQRVTSAEGEIDAVTGDVTIVKTDVTNIKQTASQLQTTVSGIQTDVTGIGSRLSTAETQVTQNKNNITLKANQTDLSTLTGRVSTAESSLTVQANQIATKVTSTDVQSQIDTSKSVNYGYRYYKKITLYGSSTSQYYPVVIKGGDQNVKRDIMIKRDYYEQAPPDWFNTTHKGGLTLKLKTNFGGWGGANYSWEVHELEEMYSNTFAGAMNVGNQTMFAIFLRGGGATGAVYHIYSDQPLDSSLYSGGANNIPSSPQLAYAQDLIFETGTYLAYAPLPRTYTQSVIDEIATRNFIKLSQNSASRITTAESSIVQQANQIALKAESTTVYTKAEADTKLGTKVDNSTYNAKVAEIKLTTDGITSTVSSIGTDLDTAESNITTVTQKANSIESNVTSLTNTVTSQGTAITSQGTSITQMNNAIALKAEKTDVYTKVESDGKISTAVTTAKADIKVTTDGITSTVTAVDNKVNNLKFGGTNLLQGTKDMVGKSYKTAEIYNGFAVVTASPSTGYMDTFSATTPVLDDTDYTVSFYAKSTNATQNIVCHFYSPNTTTNGISSTGQTSVAVDGGTTVVVTNVWKRYWVSWKQSTGGSTKSLIIGRVTAVGNASIAGVKFEKGMKASDWTPAIEDIDATFNTINSNVTAVDQKATGIQTTVTNLNSTVTGQGTRLSTAETTIGQHATSINLKANAIDVYNKTSMDTELGKKVDTTTYSNKMSAIDISVNGINQTVSTQNTTLNGLSGTVTTHTSQISTIDQKADGIALRVTETEGDISGIEGRVGTAETQITTNKNAITLKASQSSVDSLGTRVGTAEGALTVQAGQIATKVAQTAFDSAVGVNKWIARRYDMNLGSSTVVPTFDHIKGKTPVSVIEYSDVAILSAFTGDYFVAHYFTNIYMASPKTVVLSVTNDDGASIFLNGASVYGTGSTTTPTNASVSFRAGWNTLEILHHEYQGAENVNIRTTIASQVDKMTSVIGVGNKDETRLSQAESSIIQTSTAIALKADSTVTTALGNRITTAEGTLTVQAGQIATKVAQTTFDGYANRVTTAESTIVQQGNLIATKVAQTDFDALNGKYTTQQTSITQLTNEISLKVSKIEHDALNDKYVEQQSSIEQLADSITSKVSFVDHDDLTQQVSVQETQVLQTASEVAIVATKADVLDGRITDSEAQIVVQASQIALKASQSSLDTLTGRVGTAESSLTVQAGQIATKVTQTQVDTSISNEKRIKDTRTTNQNPDWYWTNNKTQTVEEFKDRVVIGVTGTATFGVLTTYVPWTDSSGGAITQQYVSADGVFNRRSATGTTWTPWLKSEDIAGSQKKVDDFNTNVIVPIVTRVSTAESSITQQAGQIALKASQSSMDTLTGRVGTAEASIVTQAGQIASKVAQTTFDTGIADAKKEASVRVIDSTTKVFSNVAGYNSNVGAPVGAIVFESPISFSYMTRLDIKGYNYNGATSDIDLSVSFYAYSDKTFINHSYTSKGNFSLGKVRLARSGNNTVIILGDINTVWSYPKVYIEKAVLGFSASPDSYKDGWVSLLKTDLSAYTNMTDVAYGRELESINGAQAKVNLLNTNEIAPLKTRVSTAESSITQQANQIALKVNQTDFNSATGRLSVAESSITQQAGLITTKVEKDGVISSVNQSPEGIKVNANRLDITGIVTFSSMDVPTQNKINVIESTANYANDIAVLNTDVNNYVLNPSFEGKRATGHTVATAKAKADAGVPVGSPQPFVGLQTVKENYATDFFSVKAGEVFIVEGWVASTNSVQTFGLGLETNDSAGTSALLMTGHVGKGTGVWQSFYKTYTIPTGVVKARFASQINATSSFGSWYLTDLRITKLVGDDVIANSANWNSANNFVNTWKTPSKTTINGANIETGSISASMIKTNELVVGQNVQMGTGAVIDWNNVMSKPAIVSPSDVKLTKIDANGVYTGTVIADNVRGGLLSGVQINVDTDIYIGNSVKLGGGIYNTNTVKSIQFNSTDSWIYTNGGSLEFSTSGHLRFVSHANFLSSVSFAGASAVDWGNHAPVAKFG